MMSAVRKIAGRFQSDARGATAVEFALIAVPFLALMSAIIEVAFIIWATQNLDHVLEKTARPVFTGGFQEANKDQKDPKVLLERLKTSFCSSGGLLPVFECQNIKLDVVTPNSYAGGNAPTPFDSNTGSWKPNAGTQYSCPKPGSIVIVSAAVKFPVFFSFLKGPQTFLDGSRLLQSTTVFRTEPYQTTSSTSCGS